jgi:HEAT repeat protein
MEHISPQIMHRLVFTVLMQHLPEAQTGPALQILSDALSHPNAQIRELAVVALSELPAPAARRVSALALGMRDVTARVRRRAARAIGDQGPAAHAALQLLVSGLKDTDPSVRRDCAGTLGRLGPVAAAAAPLLVPMLADPETRTRAVLAVALKRIGRAAVPALLTGLRAADPDLRGRCVTLLGQIAPDDERVELALKAMGPDEHPEVRQRIDEAMLAVKTPAPFPTPLPRRLADELPIDLVPADTVPNRVTAEV